MWPRTLQKRPNLWLSVSNTRELWIRSNKLERIRKIKYLRQLQNEDWNHSVAIRSGIAQARLMFIRIRNVVCGYELDIKLKIRMIRCYFSLSVLLCGAEFGFLQTLP